MLRVHLRDPKVPRTAIHFNVKIRYWQLTDDPARVTCGTCRRMMERRAKSLKGEAN